MRAVLWTIGLLVLIRSASTTECQNGRIRAFSRTGQDKMVIKVCIKKKWRYVCSELWTTESAQVACKQLGFSESGAEAKRSSKPRIQGRLPSKLICSGKESRLIDCGADPTCFSDKPAAVICKPANCTDGEVRLAKPSNAPAYSDIHQGRIETCRKGRWGTVCDDKWDNKDATVACRQLGFTGTGAIGVSFGYFGRGSIDPIHLDDVECLGNETGLWRCKHKPLALSSSHCRHSEDAGVICPAPCSNGQIKLVNSTSKLEGRVEVCINEEWSTVCDTSWNVTDANIACRQLGFSDRGATPSSFGSGAGNIAIGNVQCTGQEQRLVDCAVTNTKTYTLKCTHENDVGVKCLSRSSGLSPQTNSSSPLSSSSPTQRSSQSTAQPLLQPKAQPVKKPASQLGGQQHQCDTKKLIPTVAALGVVCLILLMAVLGETIAIVILKRNSKKKENPREGGHEYFRVPNEEREVDNPMYEGNEPSGEYYTVGHPSSENEETDHELYSRVQH